MPRSSNCCANTRSRFCASPGWASRIFSRHHQRQLVQRVRDGRAPYLRQFRRADAGDHAQPTDWRLRPRDRTHRRRPSVEDAPGTCQRHRPRRLSPCCSALAPWWRRRSRATTATAWTWAMSAGRCSARRNPTWQHTLLAYQRAQEDQADRAGVRFLTMTGQSAKGMYDTFKRFADEMMFTAAYIDPYVQNHPMPAERMAALAELVKTPYLGQEGPARTAIPPRHDAGETVRLHRTRRTVLRRYPASNTSMPARYARAISAYRFGDMRAAITADRRPDPGDAQQSLFLRA